MSKIKSLENKRKLYRALFVFAIAAVVFLMVSSLSHIATAFAAYEISSYKNIGWLIGGGLEIFMILTAIARLMSDNDEQVKLFNRALYYYAGIILIANVYYTFTVVTGHSVLLWSDISDIGTWREYIKIDPVRLVFIFLFSPTIPIMAITGTEIIQVFGDMVGKVERSIERLNSQAGRVGRRDDKPIDNGSMDGQNRSATNASIKAVQSADGGDDDLPNW